MNLETTFVLCELHTLTGATKNNSLFISCIVLSNVRACSTYPQTTASRKCTYLMQCFLQAMKIIAAIVAIDTAVVMQPRTITAIVVGGKRAASSEIDERKSTGPLFIHFSLFPF